MIYALTGANGFIASHMVKRLLSEGHEVVAVVRKAIDSAECECLRSLSAKYQGKLSITVVTDLYDTDALAKAFMSCDGVFHMAATHPKYGFEDTPEGRAAMVEAAVQGTISALQACKVAGVKRVVVTSSLAAVECGNDEGALTETTWARPEVYDSEEKLTQTTWATHFLYVKSKTEQELASLKFAQETGMDLRVVVPGNLCVGPIANGSINGTMTRLRDIMSGTNTLKGAADLGVVHVSDVVSAHYACMTSDEASGRYLCTKDMVKLEDIFDTLRELYPAAPIAKPDNMDYASGVPGKSRAVQTRTEAELGVQFHDLRSTLRDAVNSMIEHNHLAAVPVA